MFCDRSIFKSETETLQLYVSVIVIYQVVNSADGAFKPVRTRQEVGQFGL